jgi:hypothetical protein
MAALISIGFKQPDGTYKNYTIAVNDETNKFGQNVSMYKEQTKEQREAKAPKEYIGNGKVFWTDGKIVKAAAKEAGTAAEPSSDLPF